MWERRLNGPPFLTISPSAMTVAPDGNVYVGGGDRWGIQDATLVKYTPDGETAWQFQYAPNQQARTKLYALYLHADFNLRAVFRVLSGSEADIVFVTLSPDGQVLAEQFYGISGKPIYYDVFASRKFDSDELVLWGSKIDADSTERLMYLRINAEGGVLAESEGFFIPHRYKYHIDCEGNLYMGNQHPFGKHEVDKFLPNGELAWHYSFSEQDMEGDILDICTDSGGNTLIVGRKRPKTGGAYMGSMSLLNETGSLIWKIEGFGVKPIESCSSLKNGGFTGYSHHNTTQGYEPEIRCLSPDGIVQYFKTDLSGDKNSTKLLSLVNGDIYISGESFGDKDRLFAAKFSLSEVLSSVSTSYPEPGAPTELSVTPNPGSGQYHVRWTPRNAAFDPVWIRIFDAVGRLVMQQQYVPKPAEETYLVVLPTGLATGLYRFVAQSGHEIGQFSVMHQGGTEAV